jgi:hypothetical protein
MSNTQCPTRGPRTKDVPVPACLPSLPLRSTPTQADKHTHACRAAILGSAGPSARAVPLTKVLD